MERAWHPWSLAHVRETIAQRPSRRWNGTNLCRSCRRKRCCCQNSIFSGITRHPDQWDGRGTAPIANRDATAQAHARARTGFHWFRLVRCPSSEVADARPGRKICVRFGRGHCFDGALNAHLTLQFGPVKTEGGLRAVTQTVEFWALEIRVEDKATCTDVFQEDEADRWVPVHVGGRQCHRGRITWFRDARFCEPFEEPAWNPHVPFHATMPDFHDPRCAWIGDYGATAAGQCRVAGI
jgi:hypothetical protein